MTKRHWAHTITAATFAVVLAAAGTAPAGAAAAGTGTGGARAARSTSALVTAYLQARATAVTAADPAAVLAPYVVAGSTLARTEARIATGMALRYRSTGRTVVGAACSVTVLDVQPADDGATASVGARAVTRFTWRNAAGESDVEASGIDHTVTLTRRGDRWLVTADAYTDVLRPACLEAAGASRARVRAASRIIERASRPPALPEARTARAFCSPRRYSDIIRYDRAAVQTYADAHALAYNPTFVRFSGADCANFASQCARAGSMPQALGSTTSGWWYDKKGTSSPGDDTYSLSWINVGRQMSYWNTRRTDWQTSVSRLARGDFIYYDWTGDGVWDHVAVVAGSNSAGQKVIDAHTTDHYRVYWKLGSSRTKYKFARVRASWVV